MNPYLFWPLWGGSMLAMITFPTLGWMSGLFVVIAVLIIMALYLQVHCLQAKDDAAKLREELQALKDKAPY